MLTRELMNWIIKKTTYCREEKKKHLPIGSFTQRLTLEDLGVFGYGVLNSGHRPTQRERLKPPTTRINVKYTTVY